MSPIKDDLISEIIRVSQTNLLSRAWGDACNGSAANDDVVAWIKNNAANYRKCCTDRLASLSGQELGSILKQLTETRKDLSEVLKDVTFFFPKQSEISHVK